MPYLLWFWFFEGHGCIFLFEHSRLANFSAIE
jgi:hypothetical protein